MKFGKEFASQMVPEWQAAYMNYNHLKILIKEILIFRRLQQQESTMSYQANLPLPSKRSSRKRKVSLNRAFGGLSNRHSVNNDKEDEVILVSAMQLSEENHQTVFLRSSEDAGESELAFFKRLDEELNKVISFYKTKVDNMGLLLSVVYYYY
ncbi:putative SPX domain-containing protein [Helianthus debilis subsp. tardiflorus]